MDSGFSAEELLPSVEYVRDTIRFMLYHMTICAPEGDVAKGRDARIRGLQKINLGNLEALIDTRWKEKLPWFIRRNVTVVSKIARESAEAFLEWCRMPTSERPRFVFRLWKYFPEAKMKGGTSMNK
jgi:hypothetical protein